MLLVISYRLSLNQLNVNTLYVSYGRALINRYGAYTHVTENRYNQYHLHYKTIVIKLS